MPVARHCRRRRCGVATLQELLLEQALGPVGGGDADEVERARVGQVDLERLGPDRGRLDDVGAELAQPRGERTGLREGAGDDDAVITGSSIREFNRGVGSILVAVIIFGYDIFTLK